MSEGSAVFGIGLSRTILAGVVVAMETNPERTQLYVSIQVIKSHEITLIRQFRIPVRRGRTFFVSTERSMLLQFANLVNAMLSFVLEASKARCRTLWCGIDRIGTCRGHRITSVNPALRFLGSPVIR